MIVVLVLLLVLLDIILIFTINKRFINIQVSYFKVYYQGAITKEEDIYLLIKNLTIIDYNTRLNFIYYICIYNLNNLIYIFFLLFSLLIFFYE